MPLKAKFKIFLNNYIKNNKIRNTGIFSPNSEHNKTGGEIIGKKQKF